MRSNWSRVWPVATVAGSCLAAAWTTQEMVMLSRILFGLGALLGFWYLLAGLLEKRVHRQKTARDLVRRYDTLKEKSILDNDEYFRALRLTDGAVEEYKAAAETVIRNPGPHFQILGGLEGGRTFMGDHPLGADSYNDSVQRLRRWLRCRFLWRFFPSGSTTPTLGSDPRVAIPVSPVRPPATAEASSSEQGRLSDAPKGAGTRLHVGPGCAESDPPL